MSSILEQLQAHLEYQIQLEGPELIVPLIDREERVPSAKPEKPSVESSSATTIHVPSETIPQDSPEKESDEKEKDQSVPSSSPYKRIHSLIPEDSPIYAMKKLDELVEYIKNTELIELDKTRKNAVPGIGDPKADLMVIGEAPGAKEDEIGEPFVGRAGQLLTKILQAIGFEREDVYITNILKSRPTDNRDPKPDEIALHIPFLWKQIALIKPKVILCAGKVSGTTLLNRPTSLKELRAEGFQDLHGIPVRVTYHPAALLRNPNWKKPTWEDVQELRKKYDELGGKQK